MSAQGDKSKSAHIDMCHESADARCAQIRSHMCGSWQWIEALQGCTLGQCAAAQKHGSVLSHAAACANTDKRCLCAGQLLTLPAP
jgi:hypothetical protein